MRFLIKQAKFNSVASPALSSFLDPLWVPVQACPRLNEKLHDWGANNGVQVAKKMLEIDRPLSIWEYQGQYGSTSAWADIRIPSVLMGFLSSFVVLENEGAKESKLVPLGLPSLPQSSWTPTFEINAAQERCASRGSSLANYMLCFNQRPAVWSIQPKTICPKSLSINHLTFLTERRKQVSSPKPRVQVVHRNRARQRQANAEAYRKKQIQLVAALASTQTHRHSRTTCILSGAHIALRVLFAAKCTAHNTRALCPIHCDAQSHRRDFVQQQRLRASADVPSLADCAQMLTYAMRECMPTNQLREAFVFIYNSPIWHPRKQYNI